MREMITIKDIKNCSFVIQQIFVYLKKMDHPFLTASQILNRTFDFRNNTLRTTGERDQTAIVSVYRSFPNATTEVVKEYSTAEENPDALLRTTTLTYDDQGRVIKIIYS